MCKSIAFQTLKECLDSDAVKAGDVRVHVDGTSPPGLFVPPPGDSAREMHLHQVREHFKRNGAA